MISLQMKMKTIMKITKILRKGERDNEILRVYILRNIFLSCYSINPLSYFFSSPLPLKTELVTLHGGVFMFGWN